jgi:hypothetical protein
MRRFLCLSLIACGARTELGAGVLGDAGSVDVHVVDAPNPCSRPDITGTLRATTDDQLVLYVNGDLVDGAPHLWSDARQYTVTLHRDSSLRNAIAIAGSNEMNTDGRDRGVIADLRFTTEAGEQRVVTNGDWRLSATASSGWYETTFDVSSWPKAVSEGPYPENPWGTVFAPFGIDSTAEWLWSYDSNEPASAKVVAETVYARRDFYIDADGHVSDSPSLCH